MLSSPLSDVLAGLSLENDAFEGVAVLVLPENVENADPSELKDASDSVALAKHLKEHGLNCKTAYDFGLKPRVLDRHGIDVWLGVVWLVEHLAAPTVVGVISAWLASRYSTIKDARIHVELKLQDGCSTSTLKFDGSLPDFQKVLGGLQDERPKTIEK